MNNQEEIIKRCPGVFIGSPTAQCRYLMNLKQRGVLPPTASTDCNPGVDNPNCANSTVYFARQ